MKRHLLKVDRLFSASSRKEINLNRSLVCGLRQSSYFTSISDDSHSTDETLRTFSTNVNEKSNTSLPIDFPILHSRHLPPQVAPEIELGSLTEEILGADIGSFYSFDSNSNPYSVPEKETIDDFHAPRRPKHSRQYLQHDISDDFSQKVEYILRGHSKLIPSSIMSPSAQNQTNKISGNKLNKSTKELAGVMLQILQRVEKEGSYFQEQAEQARLDSQVPVLDDAQTSSSGDSTSSSPNEVDLFAPRKKPMVIEKPIQERYTSPGPTIAMYDLVLDAFALCGDIQTCLDIFERAKERHILDGSYDNQNPKTLLSIMTYNSVIRACANSPYIAPESVSDIGSESTQNVILRDLGLSTALNMYQELSTPNPSSKKQRNENDNDCGLSRNDATYAYLIQSIRKYIPACRSRGNISHALFINACNDGVCSAHVQKALLPLPKSNEDGELYQKWVTSVVCDKDEKEIIGINKRFPRKWKKNIAKLTHQGSHGLY